MFINNLSGREKNLLFGAITIALLALGYTMILEPFILHWKTLNDRIDAKLTTLIKDTRLLNMYKTLEAEYVKYRDFLEVGKNEEEEFASALSEIESVSGKSACHIVNVKPRSSKILGNYKEISYEVTAEGSIHELSRFAFEIETSDKYLRIRRFTIASKTGSSGILRGTFLISKIIVS